MERIMNRPSEVHVTPEVAASHVRRIKKLAGEYRAHFTPDLFSSASQERIDAFVTTNIEKVPHILDGVRGALFDHPSTQGSGHDVAHLLDVTNSGLKQDVEYKEAGRPLSEGAKIEFVSANLTHDTGRKAEEKLEVQIEDGIVSRKDIALVAPAMIGHRLLKGIAHLPQDLQLRILYDIDSSSARESTGHVPADIVHQSDRESILGSPVIFRGIGFDIGISGRNLGVDQNPEFAKRLPMPESEEDTNWLRQYEFFGRNLYHATSPEGEKMERRNKVENTTILMLGLHDKPQALFDQTFAPELGLAGEGVHWSKKPLMEGVFEEAGVEKEAFLKQLGQMKDLHYPDTIDGLVAFTKSAMATDKVNLPDNFDAILAEKLGNCDEQDRQNFWMIQVYALMKRHKARVEDLAWYESQKNNPSVVFQTAAKWVVRELKEREDVYDKQFSNQLALQQAA
jgi:hypothetical protein